MKPEIEEFGKTLIEFVRDGSIQSNDRELNSMSTTLAAGRWQVAARDGTSTTFARVLIPDVVDETIFYLLRAIDQGLLRITYSASNGKVVDLTEQGLGELSGWYTGSGGWREMFSKERFVDDLSDV
jgi:hypothetical protein